MPEISDQKRKKGTFEFNCYKRLELKFEPVSTVF